MITLTDNAPRPSGRIAIAAGSLADPTTLPDRCVRHGSPATRGIDFLLRPQPPKRAGLRTNNVFGMIGIVAEAFATDPVVRVTGWPLCTRCARIRRVRSTLAVLLLATGLVAVVATFVVRVLSGHPSAVLAAPLFGGLLAIAAAPFAFGGVLKLIRGRTVPDGSALEIAGAHPDFVEALRRSPAISWTPVDSDG